LLYPEGYLNDPNQEAAIDLSHGAFCHSNLVEGNYTPNIEVGSRWGNNGYMVMFRNYATSTNDNGMTWGGPAINPQAYTMETASIGNVVLAPVIGTNAYAYGFGNDGYQWDPYSPGSTPNYDGVDNGQAQRMFTSHLDYVTGTGLYVNPDNPVTTLPNSLYLKSKPAFFGNYTWPPVDPTAPTFETQVSPLPAKDRYEAIMASKVPVTSISGLPASMVVGTPLTLSGTVNPSNASDKNILWSITDAGTTGAALLDNNVLDAAATGTVTLNAMIINITNSSIYYSQDFTVNVVPSPIAVTGVSLDQTDIELAVGGTCTLKATLDPADATTLGVTWVSDDTSVATVDGGVVTAIAEGGANITATTVDGGFMASCAVTVSTDTETATETETSASTDTSTSTETETSTSTDTSTLANLPGDVDGNGVVTLSDLAALRKYLADWDVTINFTNSDVNKDGNVDLLDLALLRKYFADWDVVLK